MTGDLPPVMAGLVPAVHVFPRRESKTWMPRDKPGHDESGVSAPEISKAWMAGTSPAMTTERLPAQCVAASSRQMPSASCAGRSEIENSTDSFAALWA
jgi:hypothetical protein